MTIAVYLIGWQETSLILDMRVETGQLARMISSMKPAWIRRVSL